MSLCITVFTVAFAIIAVCPSRLRGQQQDTRPELKSTLSILTKVNLDARDFSTAIQRFAKQSSLPIGFESLPGAEESKTVKRFNVHSDTESVQSALDQVIAIDGRYQWAQDSGVISVHPIGLKDPLLETIIDKFDLHQVDKHTALDTLANTPGLKSIFAAQHVHFRTLRSIVGGLPTNEPTISLSLKDVTVRKILNEMMLQFGSHFWIFYRYGDQNQFVAIDM